MYQKWIQKGLDKGFEALEIFVSESKSFKLTLDNNKVESLVESDLVTVNIKGIYDNKSTEVYFEKIDEETVDKMLDALKQNTQTVDSKDPAIIFEGSSSYPEWEEKNFDFSVIPLDKKIKLLKDLEKNMSSSKVMKKIETNSYKEVFSKKTLINSKGLHLEQENSYAYLYVSAIFKKDSDVQSFGKFKFVKDFQEFNPEKQAQEVVVAGEKKLNGATLKSKSYPTVFSNEMFTDILASFSSVFTGQSAYRNLTQLKDKEKQVIASPQVNIIEDPFSDQAFFKEKFDDEGVVCQPKNVVENGFFKGFIHNLKTAKIFNTQPTGNGFGGGTGFSNCYLKPGQRSLEDMISTIEEGVFIDDLVGMHVGIQTVSGDFSLQASGFKIEKGKITTPVKMIVVSGNFFDILKKLKEIANDFEFQVSGFGSASVYAGDLMIGGN
ncbi:MAG: TldD/PmbA family protein [Lettuce witches'-broom phytoplasma]